ncbi:MAG: phosphomannomutase [Caldiserica bacterium]|nr:MAG: phosphomannomutase [Caldisericota bacterium]
MINPLIFREYDIRGIAEKDLTDDVVYQIAKGFAKMCISEGIRDAIVGMDGRNSSPRIKKKVIEGLINSGINVIDIGRVPTPVFYFATHHLKIKSGIQVTGSHNPPEYNGLKMSLNFSTIFGEKIKRIYEIVLKKDFVDGKGELKNYNIVPDYQNFLKKDIKIQKNNLKIVLDAGNGVGGEVFLPVLKDWGFEVYPLYIEVDGNFPNHFPDPTVPDNLKDLIEKVKETNADIGIAFDGDADRIGIIDEKGNIIWGDRLLIFLSKFMLKRNPKGKVVFEVKCSKSLPEMVEKYGGVPIMWRTGHSPIEDKIKIEKAILGGEMSGHIYFYDRYFGYDDAIYTAARVIEILSNLDSKISDVLKEAPIYPVTPEIRIECKDEVKFKIVEELTEHFKRKTEVIDIDGARIIYPDGWGLVRASNTQPVLVLRFEANTEKRLEEIKKEIEGVLEEIMKKYK